MARACARRRRAAETIFMALVICRVLFTLRMRRLKSSTLAIVYPLRLGFFRKSRLEVFRVLLQRIVQPLLDVVIELLLLGEIVEQCALPGGQITVEAILKCANLRNLELIEIALRSSKENNGLLLPC